MEYKKLLIACAGVNLICIGINNADKITLIYKKIKTIFNR